MRPEFIDSLFPSKGEGRDVTRVQSFGSVKLQLDVTIQGAVRAGGACECAGRRAGRADHFPSGW